MNYHNEVRNQTGGANFNMLTWDANLAIVAQNYSDQCGYKHNDFRTIEYESIGGVLSVGTRGFLLFKRCRPLLALEPVQFG